MKNYIVDYFKSNKKDYNIDGLTRSIRKSIQSKGVERAKAELGFCKFQIRDTKGIPENKKKEISDIINKGFKLFNNPFIGLSILVTGLEPVTNTSNKIKKRIRYNKNGIRIEEEVVDIGK